MFDDPRKELKRLEEQLLQQEMEDEEFERFYQDVYEEFGTDEDEEPIPEPVTRTAPRRSTYADIPRAVAPKKRKSIRGLVITVCLESVAIAALVLWWLKRLM